MQEWEKRFLHARDVRDLDVRLGFCSPPPEPDPEYGTLVPAGPVRRFSGGTFWPALERLGHTAVGFSQCECRNRA